jgi:hypothetical protein
MSASLNAAHAEDASEVEAAASGSAENAGLRSILRISYFFW